MLAFISGTGLMWTYSCFDPGSVFQICVSKWAFREGESGDLLLNLNNAVAVLYVMIVFVKHQLFQPERFGGLIFTSPRAVEAVKICLDSHKHSESGSHDYSIL